MPMVFDKQQQQIEHLRCQRHELAVASQDAVEAVDSELAKFI
jgi:hypothetical protein